jgi:hypothetical protein
VLRQKAGKQRETHQRFRAGMLSIDADDVPLFFFRWSRLNQLISHRLAYLSRDQTVAALPLAYRVYALEEDANWQQAWRATARLFRQTNDLATSIGARYVVVAASTPHGVWGAENGLERLIAAYPGMAELNWDLDKPDKRIAKFCRENDIPFLALEPLFRVETGRGRRLHFHYNGHWNAEGDDLAAQHIADFLLALENEPDGS